MDALARAAGVTRPVVYEHFGDREGLIVALLERHAERVAAGVAASARPGTFEDELRAATRAYLTAARRSGGPMRGLVAAENLSPAIEAARRRYWGAAAAVWADRYRERTGLPAPDAHALAVAHLAALSALAGLCIRGAIGIARATDLHVVSCLAALDALSPPEEQP